MHKLLLLLLPVLLFSWQEYKEIDGIKIYKKYDKKFEFVQFKAQTQMPYSSEVISNIIMNPQTYPSWLADCIQADSIDKQVYLLMQPPWPLDQRQVWAEIQKTEYADRQVITLRSIKKYESKNRGVWFNNLYAEFVLEETQDLQTRVTLTLLGDPGGYPPSWLVNLMAWQIPYKSLKGLNTYIRNGQ
ncbi:MAG: hypothetical protein PF439_11775 [Helicobacteraceae bacterium]|nr:hypothetical protein [Helicobacteraceae bacterium]